MKRYCDACRHYCDEAAMFCPTCGQYTVATEVERIAPEGDVIYPFAHYQMSYKDTFLYVMGKKFMDTDGRASRREFFQFLLLWHIAIVGLLAVLWIDSHIPNGAVSNRISRSYRCHTQLSFLNAFGCFICTTTP